MVALAIAVVIICVYLGYVIATDKAIPESISDTFYTSGKWMFSIVIWLEAILLMLALMDVTPVTMQFIVFFIGAGLTFVGAAPHFHEKFEKKVHYSGAITFAVSSVVWYWLVPAQTDIEFGAIGFGLIWAAAALMALRMRDKVIFWGEVACILTLVLGRIMMI